MLADKIIAALASRREEHGAAAATGPQQPAAQPPSDSESRKKRGNRVERVARPDGVVVFRARSLEEILPAVREELGPDALILRQREGLTGGFAGFFQRRCVEVEARAAGAALDCYDGDEAALPWDLSAASADEEKRFSGVNETPASDEAEDLRAVREGPVAVRDFRELLERLAPVDQRTETSRSGGNGSVGAHAAADGAGSSEGADSLALNGGRATPADVAPAGGTSSPDRQREPASAAALRAALRSVGFSAEFAERLVADATRHLLPFGTPRGLKRYARQALAARIAISPPPATAAPLFAIAGPPAGGRTTLARALASAYAAAGREVVVASGDETEELAGRSESAIVIAELPALAGDGPELPVLLADLPHERPVALVVCVPATYSAAAAARLLERCRRAGDAVVAVTHLDLEPAPAGVVEAVARVNLPVLYVAGRGIGRFGLEPANAWELASRLVR